MSTRKAALAVLISGDTQQLEKALLKAGGGLDKFGKKAEQNNQRVGTSFASIAKRAIGAGAAVVGAYASVAAAKSAVEATETLAHSTLLLSKSFGLTTHAASEWAAVAQSRGTDGKALTMGFKALATATRNAEQGSKAQAKAFDELGISHAELKKHGDDVNFVLHAVSDGLAKMPGGTDKAAISAKLFGRTWTTISPLIRDGSDALDKQLQLADKYGATFDEKGVGSLENFIKAQREARLASLGLQVAFGTQVAPALTKVIKGASGFAAEMRDGTGAGGQFAHTAEQIWTEVKPVATWLARAGDSIGHFVEHHPEVGKLAAGILAVGAAVKTLKFVSAATGFTDLLKAGRAAASGLKTVLARGGTAAGAAAAENAADSVSKSDRFKAAGRTAGRNAGKAFGVAFTIGAVIGLTDIGAQVNKKIKTELEQAGLWNPPGGVGSFWDNIIPTQLFPKVKAGKGLVGQLGQALGLLHKASGGVVPGSGRGDVVPAMLEPGEHVWTRDEVQAAGGHDAVYAMRELFTTGKVKRFSAGGIVSRANAIDSKHYPYVWGGGHGRTGVPNGGGYDCSGAVSAVLGVSPPRVSGGFESWGSPGPGNPMDTKVYANADHVFMVINGKGWGTSRENPGGGAGWLSYNDRPGFTIRHTNDGSASNSGSSSAGDSQERTETGKANKTAQQERAGSRLVNALVKKDLKGVSALTSGAASLGTAIDDADTTYAQTERLFGQVVGGQAGKYGDEKLDTKEGRAERTSELVALQQLKTAQKRRMAQRKAALEKAVRRYDKLIKDLEKARKKAHGSKRVKINERLKSYDDRRIELAAEAKSLRSSIKDIDLDIGDLNSEMQDVAATPDTAPDTPDAAPAFDLGQTQSDAINQALGDVDLQERAGVLTSDQARDQRISMIQSWLGGALGPLDQRTTWELLGDLRDAQQDNTAATSDLAAQMKALTDEVAQSNALAQTEVAIGLREARRAIADMVSGQLGARVGPRALLPGNGELSRLF